ncbi:MAG TPA: class I SAM-dependent methyltransferase [Saprospiraceae bacterium]|nr:class I SAM-dependent methyltransferase [Saprospiraceae bacterium]
MINLPFDVIGEYCARFSTPADDILNALERETHLKTIAPQMLAGAHQGRFLQMLSTLLQPERILEIGSFTGYSAICFARGLKPGGIIDTIEFDPEYSVLFNKYVAQAGLSDRIKLHNGDARVILKGLKGPYDLVFIDAGKREYPEYYEAAVNKTKKGGLILLDNMLWDGKVPENIDDEEANVLRALAKTILNDTRVECVMLPLRDGIMLVRKAKAEAKAKENKS